MIKVLVSGASGKMGQATVEAINAATDLTLIGTCGSKDNLNKQLEYYKPDVVVDFTLPHIVFNNTLSIIEHQAHPVIGTSGLTELQLQDIAKKCAEKKLGGIYAPNFSLGAVLMIKYAEDAARYFNDAEIIEMHHEKKIDAPSGTAVHTRHRMLQANAAVKNDVPIHSVRLPGLFAHQEIIFGSTGETLTIRHDAMDRQCMMPGVVLACRTISRLDHFVIGLEHIL